MPSNFIQMTPSKAIFLDASPQNDRVLYIEGGSRYADAIFEISTSGKQIKKISMYDFRTNIYVGDRNSFKPTDVSNSKMRTAIEDYMFEHFQDRRPKRKQVKARYDTAGLVDQRLDIRSHNDLKHATEVMWRSGERAFCFAVSDHPGRGCDANGETRLWRPEELLPGGYNERIFGSPDQRDYRGPKKGLEWCCSVQDIYNPIMLEARKEEVRREFLGILNDKALGQPDTRYLYDFLKLLRYNTHDHYPREVRIPGMYKALHLHQAHAVSWMMHQERGPAGGGFLADDKEYTPEEIIGLCIMERLLHRGHQKRVEDKVANPASHLVGCDECPSEKTGEWNFPLACSCPKGSPSAIPRKLGPTLLLIPEHQISTWVVSIRNMVNLGHADLDMELVVLSKSGSSPNILVKAAIGLAGKPESGRYIVVTSPASYNNPNVWRASQVPDITWGRIIRDDFHLDSRGRGQRSGGVTIKLIRDLQHQRDPRVWFVSDTPFDRAPNEISSCIEVFKSSVSEWASRDSRKSDEQRKLEMHVEMPNMRSAERVLDLNKVLMEWDAVKSGLPTLGVDVTIFTVHFREILLGLMLRRTLASEYRERPIKEPLTVQRHHRCTAQQIEDIDNHKIRECAEWILREKMAKRLKEYRHQRNVLKWNPYYPHTSIEEWYQLARVLRMTAVVPGLATLAVNGYALTTEEMLTEREVGAPDIYQRTLDTLGKSSSKLRELQIIIQSMLDDGKRKSLDEKVIVLSSFPLIAYITHLWLLHLGFTTVLMEKREPNKGRMMRSFQGELGEDGLPLATTATGRGVEATTVLVSTYGVIPTEGYRHDATRLVFLDPSLHRREDEELERLVRYNKKVDLAHIYTITGPVAPDLNGVFTLVNRTERNIQRLRDGVLHWNHLGFKEQRFRDADAGDFAINEPKPMYFVFRTVYEQPPRIKDRNIHKVAPEDLITITSRDVKHELGREFLPLDPDSSEPKNDFGQGGLFYRNSDIPNGFSSAKEISERTRKQAVAIVTHLMARNATSHQEGISERVKEIMRKRRTENDFTDWEQGEVERVLRQTEDINQLDAGDMARYEATERGRKRRSNAAV